MTLFAFLFWSLPNSLKHWTSHAMQFHAEHCSFSKWQKQKREQPLTRWKCRSFVENKKKLLMRAEYECKAMLLSIDDKKYRSLVCAQAVLIANFFSIFYFDLEQRLRIRLKVWFDWTIEKFTVFSHSNRLRFSPLLKSQSKPFFRLTKTATVFKRLKVCCYEANKKKEKKKSPRKKWSRTRS